MVAQTIAQLADQYGETYMHTLLGTLRHKMVFGDIPDYDAQLFSKIFGEKEKFEEGIQEQAVSPLQEKPMLRMGNTYTKVKEAKLSPNDIIYQKEFQCAVKIVANNRPIPVTQIDANFVPQEEFSEAVVSVDAEAAQIWLDNRNRVIEENIPEETLLEDFEVLVEEEDNQTYSAPPIFPAKQQPLDLNATYIVDNEQENVNIEAIVTVEEIKLTHQEESSSQQKISDISLELEVKEIESSPVIQEKKGDALVLDAQEQKQVLVKNQTPPVFVSHTPRQKPLNEKTKMFLDATFDELRDEKVEQETASATEKVNPKKGGILGFEDFDEE